MTEVLLMPDAGSRLTIVYDGSLATQGDMFFYEFSRAAYGASRLITTIELFRRTGRVAKRVSSHNYVPLIIRAPERGSFPIDILIPIAMQASQIIKEYDIPVGDFIKYIIHVLKRTLPKDEETIVKLAQLDVQREAQRTAQSQAETDRLVEVRKIVESGNANTAAAINVLERSLASQDRRIASIGQTNLNITRILRDLNEQRKRQRDLDVFSDKFEAIGEEKLLQLTSKVRPQLGELGVPLRRDRSASTVTFKIDGSSFARFDEDAIQDINARSLDQEEASATLRIFAYDKDSGYGKCDLVDLEMPRISFAVPVNIRSRLRGYVISAMNEDAVSAVVRYFRNKGGSITSLLIYRINVVPIT